MIATGGLLILTTRTAMTYIKVFVITHQSLAIVLLYSIWLHVRPVGGHIQWYTDACIALWASNLGGRIISIVYHSYGASALGCRNKFPNKDEVVVLNITTRVSINDHPGQFGFVWLYSIEGLPRSWQALKKLSPRFCKFDILEQTSRPKETILHTLLEPKEAPSKETFDVEGQGYKFEYVLLEGPYQGRRYLDLYHKRLFVTSAFEIGIHGSYLSLCKGQQNALFWYPALDIPGTISSDWGLDVSENQHGEGKATDVQIKGFLEPRLEYAEGDSLIVVFGTFKL